MLDKVLALGTGTAPKDPVNTRWKPNAIKDLWNSFMSFLDGESTWQCFENGLAKEAREDYLRFNPPLLKSSKLDEANVRSIRQSVSTDGLADQPQTAFHLLVSNFYFKLDGLWQYEEGVYQCRGSIRCRADVKATFQALESLGASKVEFVTGSKVFSGCRQERDICHKCDRYCKAVRFHVRHPTDTIVLSLRCEIGTRKLSGFPQTITEFAKQQELDSPFGTLDHDNSRNYQCSTCEMAPPMLKRQTSPLLNPKTKRCKPSRLQ